MASTIGGMVPKASRRQKSLPQPLMRPTSKHGYRRNWVSTVFQGPPVTTTENVDKRRYAANPAMQPEAIASGEWWGICDGWSAAAILTPEPQRGVTRHGVHFKVNDIKALLSVAYQGFGSGMIGARCNRRGDPTCDAAGRPHDFVHRSTNPGSFHIILTNFVGLQQRSFVIDRDPSYRVFNQPVSRYEVHALEPLDAQQASRILRTRAKRYPYNARAQAWARVQTTIYYIMDPEHFQDGPLIPSLSQYETPMHLDYVLELNAEGNIIGGEWVGRSQVLHPDFAWDADNEAPLGFWDMLRPQEREAIDALSEAASQPL